MIPYLAGFFDGEGCITISNNGSLCLGVVNTSQEVLNEFVKHLGGTVTDRKQIVNKKQYVWRAYGEEACNILRQLDVHLIEKQDQAFLGLQWMRDRNKYPTVSGQGRGRYTHPDRAEAITKYQTQLTQMKLGTYIAK